MGKLLLWVSLLTMLMMSVALCGTPSDNRSLDCTRALLEAEPYASYYLHGGQDFLTPYRKRQLDMILAVQTQACERSSLPIEEWLAGQRAAARAEHKQLPAWLAHPLRQD